MPRTIEFNREEVLLKAMFLFNEKGYAACSIQNLLDVMGLNRGSLYASFGDKRALYLEILSLHERLFVAELEAFLLSGDSPVQQIHTFFDIAYLSVPEEQMRAGCLFVNTIAEMTDIDQELVETAGLKLGRLETALEKALITARDKGELKREKDPVAISRFLASTMKGLRITSKETQDKAFISSIIKTALTVLEN